MEENTVNTSQPAEAAGKATFDQVLQDPDYRRAFDERVRTAVSRRFRTVDAQRAQIRELAGEMGRRLGLAPGEDGQVDLDALREALAEDSAPADRRIATPPLAARNDEDFGSCKDHQFCHSEEARRSDVGIRNDPGAAEKRIAPQGYLPPRAGSEIREEAGATAAGNENGDPAANQRSVCGGERRQNGTAEPWRISRGEGSEVSADDDEAPIRASFRRLLAEGEHLRQLYPGLDLGAELANPRFAALLASLERTGAPEPLRMAYEATHHDQILGGVVRYAVERTAAQIAEGVRSGALRPAENGGTAASDTRLDPGNLTADQRRDIRQRVMRGERITF